MSRPRRAVPWIAVVAAAVSCSRGPAATYDVNRPSRWDVGEVVTRTERKENSIAMHGEQWSGGAAPVRTRRTESRIVQRCLQIDANGAMVGSVVYVATWSFREDAAEDRSLERAFVETSAAGWKLMSKDSRPSADARKWLDAQFGPGVRSDAAVAAEFRAPHPLAVGERWDVPSADFLRQALGASLHASTGKDADFQIAFVGVASTPFGESVHLAETLDAPVTSGPSDAGRNDVGFSVGTRLTMKADFRFVPGRTQRSSAKTIEGNDVYVTIRDGRETRAVSTSKTEFSSVAGGEMPEPPAK